jgi:hypothetical protein
MRSALAVPSNARAILTEGLLTHDPRRRSSAAAVRGESLSSLRKRLRQRFERGPADGNLERLRITNLGVDEHAALAGLMGRSVRFSSSMQIDVPLIDAALSRAGIATSLRAALEFIDGPIIHTETARAELQAEWLRAVTNASHADLLAFLQMPSGLGLLKRLSNGNPDTAAQLCRLANAVVNSLPADGMTRAQLAAETLGDAHALDNGRPAAALVLAVWREKAAPKQDSPGEDLLGVESEIGDERIRDVWAKAGVLVNELARPALFLNLKTKSHSSLLNATGEPTYASRRFASSYGPALFGMCADKIFTSVKTQISFPSQLIGAEVTARRWFVPMECRQPRSALYCSNW